MIGNRTCDFRTEVERHRASRTPMFKWMSWPAGRTDAPLPHRGETEQDYIARMWATTRWLLS